MWPSDALQNGSSKHKKARSRDDESQVCNLRTTYSSGLVKWGQNWISGYRSHGLTSTTQVFEKESVFKCLFPPPTQKNPNESFDSFESKWVTTRTKGLIFYIFLSHFVRVLTHYGSNESSDSFGFFCESSKICFLVFKVKFAETDMLKIMEP